MTGDHLPISNILLFDGECSLCHWSVRFVLRYEKKPTFYFAALNSDLGKKLLQQYNIDPLQTDSIVFVSNQQAYIKSKALINISFFLKSPFSWFQFFRYVPSFLMDKVYDLIAKHRYKIFGKVEYCDMPNDQTKGRMM